MTRRLILDVDTGIDDALGIMLAVKSGVFQIEGLTTVNGNVSLQQATLNTCKITEFLGASSIPVIPGADKPLIRRPVFEHRVHGNDGLGGALLNMQPSKRPEAGFGPDFIVETVLRHPGEVTLVMTGPLTNLALALHKCPDLIHHMAEVIFMGGVAGGLGNITPTAEYNAYVDPEAARAVLHAGFPKLTMVGLDVTRRALLRAEDIAKLTNPHIREYVTDSTSAYFDRYEERNGVRACAMHDPLAVAAAIHPELVTAKSYYVDVETRSELCDGQTVCDFQNRLGRPANVEVCMDLNEQAFIQLFVDTLNRPEAG
ncbi:nucleoside hydrolase [Paenibacillus physcomitrellae]|uniref:Nucleoside hydrolase n=1 Tax=Paenibacillus physcomitrellae TaxID=1619311 RepID=A0ABQ1FPI1_9BACL|nr:nucleoside hydrolase [Paenibacillus physcomitrellae]GGA24034.1 nucleoside hydrolase [Paenibacillus physcomitrellae]